MERILFVIVFFIVIVYLLSCNILATRLCHKFYQALPTDFFNPHLRKRIALFTNSAGSWLYQLLIPIVFTTAVFSLFLALIGVYEYTLITAVTLTTILYIGNYLKFSVLHEPLVWSDFCLVREMIIAPRLYFAYISGKIWSVLAIAVLLLAIVFYISPVTSVPLALRLWCGGIAIGGSLLTICLLPQHKLAYESLLDGMGLSPLTALLTQLYLLPHALRHLPQNTSPKLPSITPKRTITLIQAESYCSLERLQMKDKLAPQDYQLTPLNATHMGILDIQYLGAYTMRSEFAVLTGMNLRKLGIFAYDPYQLAKRIPLASLASALAQLGYHTVCIHPNKKEFFARHKVMVNLGFAEFIALDELPPLPKVGNNISDEALFAFIHDYKQQHATEKLFLFIITIEAHGPWLGNIVPNTPKADPSLTEYAVHISNYVKGFTQYVQNSSVEESILMYGDHLPALSALYHTKSALKPDVYAVNMSLKPQELLQPKDLYQAILRTAQE